MIQRQINIRQRLRLYTLRRVHNQNRAVARRQRPAHLIIEIHMSRRIDQIKNILVSILCLIDKPDGLGFDRNAPLPLQIHIVKHLILHLPAGKKPGLLNDPVRQSGFAVVDMCDNTKVPDPA